MQRLVIWLITLDDYTNKAIGIDGHLAKYYQEAEVNHQTVQYSSIRHSGAIRWPNGNIHATSCPILNHAM